MLKCPKCGTDNLLSAVFCRGCGERMNLDEIKPDDFENIGTKKDSTTMQNIIGGIIIGVLIVGFLVGFCFPSCGALGTTEEGQNAVMEKYLSKPSDTYTDQEITDFCNKMLARSDGEFEGPVIKGISIRCNEDGTVKVFVKATFFGFLPGTVSVTCNVNNSSGRISLSGDQVKIGLFPLPEGLEENLFYPLKQAGSSIMDDANTKIKSLNISEGQAVIGHGRIVIK